MGTFSSSFRCYKEGEGHDWRGVRLRPWKTELFTFNQDQNLVEIRWNWFKIHDLINALHSIVLTTGIIKKQYRHKLYCCVDKVNSCFVSWYYARIHHKHERWFWFPSIVIFRRLFNLCITLFESLSFKSCYEIWVLVIYNYTSGQMYMFPGT